MRSKNLLFIIIVIFTALMLVVVTSHFNSIAIANGDGGGMGGGMGGGYDFGGYGSGGYGGWGYRYDGYDYYTPSYISSGMGGMGGMMLGMGGEHYDDDYGYYYGYDDRVSDLLYGYGPGTYPAPYPYSPWGGYTTASALGPYSLGGSLLGPTAYTGLGGSFYTPGYTTGLSPYSLGGSLFGPTAYTSLGGIPYPPGYTTGLSPYSLGGSFFGSPYFGGTYGPSGYYY